MLEVEFGLLSNGGVGVERGLNAVPQAGNIHICEGVLGEKGGEECGRELSGSCGEGGGGLGNKPLVLVLALVLLLMLLLLLRLLLLLCPGLAMQEKCGREM